MKLATIISVGITAATITFSAALAQQAHTGVITEVNRLTNTIAIRPIQNGTVGTNSGAASESFKIQSGISLDSLHAGDRVGYSASDGSGNPKTITKIQRQ